MFVRCDREQFAFPDAEDRLRVACSARRGIEQACFLAAIQNQARFRATEIDPAPIRGHAVHFLPISKALASSKRSPHAMPADPSSRNTWFSSASRFQFGSGEGQPDQSADREREQVGPGMAKTPRQHARPGFFHRLFPEQGRHHFPLAEPDPQALQEKQKTRNDGQTREKRERTKVRETHTDVPPSFENPGQLRHDFLVHINAQQSRIPALGKVGEIRLELLVDLGGSA